MTQRIELSDIGIIGLTGVSAVGHGKAAHLTAMRNGQSGLSPCTFPGADVPCYTGAVEGLESIDFPSALASYDNRATRLSLAALETDGFAQRLSGTIERWGADRVGIVLGTSTSGVERLERDYRISGAEGPLSADYSIRDNNDHQAVTAFLIDHLGLRGPSYTISTACSSSAKAIIDGAQLIQLGLADAVLTGGVDSLCLTSIYGFESLELVSREQCRPFDVSRSGLSIGEAAAFLLLERRGEGPRLAGYGESSDATSMSTPPPDGAGAAAAMRQALSMAGLQPVDVDYLKLHATATPINDAAETAAVSAVFGTTVPVASFKGLIGHTLGAAGAIEAVMSLYAMAGGFAPGSAGCQTPDPEIEVAVRMSTTETRMTHVLNNAFGFGGSNCSIILGAA